MWSMARTQPEQETFVNMFAVCIVPTLPQARQWWRLTSSENSAWHAWHMATLLSGTHTGAVSPSSPCLLRVREDLLSVMKVFFFWMKSS